SGECAATGWLCSWLAEVQPDANATNAAVTSIFMGEDGMAVTVAGPHSRGKIMGCCALQRLGRPVREPRPPRHPVCRRPTRSGGGRGLPGPGGARHCTNDLDPGGHGCYGFAWDGGGRDGIPTRTLSDLHARTVPAIPEPEAPAGGVF